MAQLAYYHMADCYLKAGQKRQARGAFREASRMRFDEQITEDALFNFAKISYELSFDPYNEAIEAFEEYIDEHPNSPRVDEAYSFLLQVYLTTRDFGKALISLDRIKDKDEVLKKTYQKVAYLRGIELFNDQDYKNSVIQLRKVKRYPVDDRILAMAQYWQSEAYARLGKQEAAEIGFVRFLEMPSAISSEEYELALYALGYTHFERKQHEKAIEYFRKFAGAAKNQDKRLNDAYLRIGDGYYLTRNTERAIDFYDKAVQIGNFDTDYAIFQISVCYGLAGQNASKIQSLKSMLDNYPSSSFAADAKYEIGETHFFMDRNDEAKKYFNMILADHQHSSYVGKAKLNLGLIAYNSSDDAAALPMFKDVTENYPTTPEAKEALFKIQKIYTEQGKVQDFEAYVSTQQFPDITQGALDTSYYQAGEFMYARSQFSKAFAEFEKYLEKFPNGYFLLNANFYLAESAVELGQEDRALKAYNEVLKYQKNTFTEKAIITAASIYFNRENYQEALLRYVMLEEVAEIADNMTEAQIGLMRCNYQLNNFVECETYCEKILKSERTDENTRLEASMTLARSAMAQNNLDLALNRYTETSALATNEIAAESMFSIAKVHFLKGNYEQVEVEVFNLMDRLPGYHQWVSEGFLLLADSYVERNDAFQARLTLQNIIDNYDDPDVTQMAQQKLMLLQREQEIDRIIHPSEDLLIQFETQRLKDSLLFELEYLDLEIEQIEETTPDQK
jgi:TolA-binding protein